MDYSKLSQLLTSIARDPASFSTTVRRKGSNNGPKAKPHPLPSILARKKNGPSTLAISSDAMGAISSQKSLTAATKGRSEAATAAFDFRPRKSRALDARGLLERERGAIYPSLFLASATRSSNPAASFRRPSFRYVDARLSMPISVAGCSVPRTLMLVSRTCASNPSASVHRS